MADRADRPDARRELAGAFTAGADAYDRLRPGYPPAAMELIIPAGARDAADVGAGTGKLATQLTAAGLSVWAIDPAAQMLALVPAGVESRVGTGEHTGLPDASVDLVTFGQSWHWVDAEAGTRELHRILRPGGRVAMLWNKLDTSVPWVARYADAMHTVDPRTDHEREVRRQAPAGLAGFGRIETREVPWRMIMTEADLAMLAETRSYWLAADDAVKHPARELIMAAVGAAPRAADGRVSVPYATEVAWADRRG
ncbi:ubiquinone/menaquinone biosynthesis C-methylase UbiE [Naumannella cuiyingiana]|uniref:Ubiquinone/menaquinone biosynthesis C-methylase UbiE n=1 Tax=Naumannella cuiyingiana TaxID=1347891 RepID=A0A7Z0IKB5_9ACTN|nr:ubiquinone/menaquinone biosynthesis C-methylase UbiE [Naumannella cuiyingiana]